MKYIGYDLGGAEMPYGKRLIVVDIQPPRIKHPSRKRNFRDPDWANGLSPRQFVYASRVIRYLETEDYPSGKHNDNPIKEVGDKNIYRQFAEQIIKLVQPGGVIVLFDYAHLVNEVAGVIRGYESVCNWFHVGLPLQVNEEDGQYPGESMCVIIRWPHTQD